MIAARDDAVHVHAYAEVEREYGKHAGLKIGLNQFLRQGRYHVAAHQEIGNDRQGTRFDGFERRLEPLREKLGRQAVAENAAVRRQDPALTRELLETVAGETEKRM